VTVPRTSATIRIVLALLALLLIQAPQKAPERDVSKFSVHELVKELPPFGDHAWDLSREKEPLLSVRAQTELRERIHKGAVLDQADWQVILLDKGYLQWRTRWPKGKCFAVQLHLPDLPVRLLLAPAIADGKPADSSFGSSSCPIGDSLEWGSGYQELGWLAAGQKVVQFDVRPYYATGSAAGLATQRVLSVGAIAIDVEQVASIDDVLVPVTDPGIGSRLTKKLSVRLPQREPWLFFGEIDWPADIACSLEVTLLEKGRAVEARRFVRRGPHEALPLAHLPAAIASGLEPATGWTLRLRGTSKGALVNWNATQYWSGEIELPLADLIRR